MTFDELKLLVAVNESSPGGVERYRQSEMLAFSKQVAAMYADLFMDVRFPFRVDDVIGMSNKWRKNTGTRVKAEIAMQHGAFSCFWKCRNKGPCCNEVEAGHLIPKCKGGPLSVENCIVECRSHNNQRSAMTIEEYLKSEKTTGQAASQQQAATKS